MLLDQEGDCRFNDDSLPIDCRLSSPVQPESRATWLEREIMPHERLVRDSLQKFADLDLNEIIQGAYLRILVAKDIPDVRDPRAYFYRVAKSEVLDRLRRRQTSPLDFVDFDQFECAADQPLPDAIFDGQRAMTAFNAALSKLSPRQQEVVRLRYFEDLNARTVASRLSLSVSAIEKHQRFGTRTIKAEMQWP